MAHTPHTTDGAGARGRGEDRLTRLREAWEKIHGAGAHDTRRECAHDQGTILYSQVNSNGSQYFYDGCRTCGKQSTPGQWLRREDINPAEATIARDMRLANPPCEVCGAWGTELHHWAPKALFGISAEHWPTSYLCTTCHTWWHNTIADPSRPF